MLRVISTVLALVALPLSAQERKIDAGSQVHQLAYLPSDGSLAAICADGLVKVWNTKDGKLVRRVPVNDKGRGLAFAKEAFVTATRDSGFRAWSLATGQPSHTFGMMRIRAAQFTPDGSMLAASTRDRRIKLWDASTWKERLDLAAGIGGAGAMAFSPDGKVLVASDDDTDVRVWNVRDGELLRRIDEVLVTTFSLAFSPDGKLLATGGADGVLRLWDTATWKVARQFTNQPEMISKLAYSPDGRLVATGGFDDRLAANPTSILIQEAATGKVVRRMSSPHIVTGLAFSPDGKQLASVTTDSTISLWDVP